MAELLPLGPGETRPFTADTWNALVAALDEQAAPSPFRIGASSRLAIVHWDDTDPANPYPMQPDRIILRDLTDWRGYEKDRVRIVWTVSGVGELEDPDTGSSVTTTGPGQAVAWTWRTGRSWDALVGGRPLPTYVEVEARAEILTTMTTLDPIATSADLPATANEGDRVLVMSEDQIYYYSGGTWQPASGATWVTWGTDRISIVVDRAFNPNLLEGWGYRLYVESDHVALGDDATARVRLQDFSTFSPEVTSVARQVGIYWRQPDGTRVAAGSEATVTKGLYYANLLAQSDRDIEIEVRSIGTLEVEVSYTHGSTTDRITRLVTITPPLVRTLPVLSRPTLPVRRLVTPGDGYFRVTLGLPVVVESASALSEVRTLPPLEPVMEQLSEQLVLRASETIPVGSEALSPVAISRLLTALGVVARTLGSSGGGQVRTYELVLTTPQAGDEEDLLLIEAGQVLYLHDEGIALRVLEAPVALETVTRAGGSSAMGVRVKVEGLLDDVVAYPLEGHISGAADQFLVRLRAYYGSDTTVHRTHEVLHVVSPMAALPAFDVVLPEERPRSVGDRWMVDLDVVAEWRGIAYERVRDEGLVAETVRQSQPLVRDGRLEVYGWFVRLPIEGEGFYGYVEWIDPDDATPAADEARVLSAAYPLRPGEMVPIPPPETPGGQLERKQLVLHGCYRSKAGSMPGQVYTRRVGLPVAPSGVPLLVRSNMPASGPDEAAPPADGVVIVDRTTGRAWVSFQGDWIPMSGSDTDLGGFGSPMLSTTPYLQAPVITGSDSVQLTTSLEDVVYEIRDDYESVALVRVTGVPSFFQVQHEYWDGGSWVAGSQTAKLRRVRLSPDPDATPEVGLWTIRIEASNGKRSSTVDYELRVEEADTSGPVISSVLVQGVDQSGQTRQFPVTLSGNVATIRVEEGSTDLSVQVVFADPSGVQDVVIPSNFSYTFQSGTLVITNLSAVRQMISGSVTDGLGNETVFRLDIDTYVVDREAPVLDTLDVQPTTKVKAITNQSYGDYEIRAYAGSKLRIALHFSDVSGISRLTAQATGFTLKYAQDGSDLIMWDVEVPTDSSLEREITVTAVDRLGNEAQYLITIKPEILTEIADLDLAPPEVISATVVSNTGESRLVSSSASTLRARPDAADSALTIRLRIRESLLYEARQVQGPTLTHVDGPSRVPNETDVYFLHLYNVPASANTYKFELVDAAGNKSYYTITIDPALPTDVEGPELATVTATATTGSTQTPLAVSYGTDGRSAEVKFDSSKGSEVTITLQLTDESGVTSASVTAPAGVSGTFDSTSQTLTVSGIVVQDGMQLKASATDAAGNNATITVTFKDLYVPPPDTSPPTLLRRTARVGGNSRAVAQVASDHYRITYEAADIGQTIKLTLLVSDRSGVSQTATLSAVVGENNPASTATATVNTNLFGSASVVVDGVRAEEGAFTVTISDTAGNSRTLRFDVEPADTQPPRLVSASSATWTYGGMLTLTLEVEDNAGVSTFELTRDPIADGFTHVSSIKYYVYDPSNAGAVGGWVEVVDGSSGPSTTRRRIVIQGTSVVLQSDAVYTGTWRAVDTFGNEQTGNYTITYKAVKDTTAPVIKSIAVQGSSITSTAMTITSDHYLVRFGCGDASLTLTIETKDDLPLGTPLIAPKPSGVSVSVSGKTVTVSGLPAQKSSYVLYIPDVAGNTRSVVLDVDALGPQRVGYVPTSHTLDWGTAQSEPIDLEVESTSTLVSLRITKAPAWAEVLYNVTSATGSFANRFYYHAYAPGDPSADADGYVSDPNFAIATSRRRIRWYPSAFGAPAKSGVYTFEWEAEDSCGLKTTGSFTLKVVHRGGLALRGEGELQV